MRACAVRLRSKTIKKGGTLLSDRRRDQRREEEPHVVLRRDLGHVLQREWSSLASAAVGSL
jgi:hypothetical protein